MCLRKEVMAIMLLDSCIIQFGFGIAVQVIAASTVQFVVGSFGLY